MLVSPVDEAQVSENTVSRLRLLRRARKPPLDAM